MTTADTMWLVPGVYRLHWKDGGASVAAVGVTCSGKRWMAPINWVRPGKPKHWQMVKMVEGLDIRLMAE